MYVLVKHLFVQLSASSHLLQTGRERGVSLPRILTLFYHTGTNGGSNVATHFFHAIALSKLRNGEGKGIWVCGGSRWNLGDGWKTLPSPSLFMARFASFFLYPLTAFLFPDIF